MHDNEKAASEANNRVATEKEVSDMQFTKAEEYGIFGILYLAQQPPEKITPLSEISQSQDVPEKFLAKIFQSLSRSGIIRSHRGVKGGFSMAKPAKEISVMEIVESIQGPYQIAKCLHTDNICDKPGCPVMTLLSEAQDALTSVFRSYTVDKLLSMQKEVEEPQSV